jgi:hypothetical protein
MTFTTTQGFEQPALLTARGPPRDAGRTEAGHRAFAGVRRRSARPGSSSASSWCSRLTAVIRCSMSCWRRSDSSLRTARASSGSTTWRLRPAEASDGHRVGVGMTRQPARSASVLSSQSSVISSVLRPLLPPKARTRAASRAGTFSTRSPSAAVRCASPSPTPRAPSTAQVRSRHGWTNWFELLVAVAVVGEPLLGQDVLLGGRGRARCCWACGGRPLSPLLSCLGFPPFDGHLDRGPAGPRRGCLVCRGRGSSTPRRIGMRPRVW